MIPKGQGHKPIFMLNLNKFSTIGPFLEVMVSFGYDSVVSKAFYTREPLGTQYLPLEAIP